MIALPFSSELAEFTANPQDAVEGALLVARIIDRNSDVAWARSEMDRLAAQVGSGPAAHICDALREIGFAGASRETYYDVTNSRLDRVLRTKRGIPISLAVVVMGLAQRFGRQTTGINFPRHFMLRVDDELVDPYAMQVASRAELDQWLQENNVSSREAYHPANPADIVLRMLNNVRMILHSSGEYVRALEVSDYQLILVPENYGVYIERSDIWGRLGDGEMVRQELQKALQFAPSRAIAQRIESRIDELQSSSTAPPDLN